MDKKTNYKTKKYFVFFCKLGSYDELSYEFNTYKEAKDKLLELEKEDGDKSFYGFVSEIKLCRSLSEGKERVSYESEGENERL